MKKLKMFKILITYFVVCTLTTNIHPSTEAHKPAHQHLSTSEMQVIEDIIGYTFKDKMLLCHAFYHNSLGKSGFQQLEFLGDRIIASVLASYSFDLTEKPESLHDKLKKKTDNKYFSQRFNEMGLDLFLKTNPGSSKHKISADGLEALVGAIQMDSGKQRGAVTADTVWFVLNHIEKIQIEGEPSYKVTILVKEGFDISPPKFPV